MNEFTLILLGNQCVGKSSISQRLCIAKQAFSFFIEQYEPTIEDLYHKTYEFNSESFLINILDTAGASEFYDVSKYITNYERYICPIYALVFSLNDKKSFNSLDDIKELIELHCESDIPLILVGNKSDLPRKISEHEVYRFRTRHNIPYVEVSAKDNTRLDRFLDIACGIYCSYYMETMTKKKRKGKRKCILY